MLQWIKSGDYILQNSRLTQTSIFYSTSTCTYNWKKTRHNNKKQNHKKREHEGKKITKNAECEEKKNVRKVHLE